MTTKFLLRQYISDALSKLGIRMSDIPIEYPEEALFGHYCSPISMRLAKDLKKNPREIAETIKTYLEQETMFLRIDVAGSGYLNFFLSDGYLSDKLSTLIQADSFGQNDSLSGETILLEYVSANPTGPLHIGHGRWAAVGDSLARVLSLCGAHVFREFYVNDAGVQIKHLYDSVQAINESKPIPDDGYHGAYIKTLAKSVKLENKAPEILIQEEHKITLSRFRVVFDGWFSEKNLHTDDTMKHLLSDLEQKDVIYQSEGALWFRSTALSKDDKDRVLVKKNGDYTYLAVDIAYHQNKIARGYHTLINILGADHHGYIERISAAVSVLGGQLTVLLGQMVNLFRHGEAVRMSKRTGDMITLDEVLDEIGVDTTRYLLLRRPMDSPVDFDLEAAKVASDINSVFYVQYAHARSAALLKSGDLKQFAAFSNDYERLLVVEIIKFEDLILDIGRTFDVHKLTIYLESLAGSFHRFYKNCRIINDPHESSRLFICMALKKVIQQGLALLGIDAPDRMDHGTQHDN